MKLETFNIIERSYDMVIQGEKQSLDFQQKN